MKFWLPVAEQETVLEESISLKALLFPLLQKALCPQVEKQLRSDFFFLFPWTLGYIELVIESLTVYI